MPAYSDLSPLFSTITIDSHVPGGTITHSKQCLTQPSHLFPLVHSCFVLFCSLYILYVVSTEGSSLLCGIRSLVTLAASLELLRHTSEECHGTSHRSRSCLSYLTSCHQLIQLPLFPYLSACTVFSIITCLFAPHNLPSIFLD